MEFSGVTAAEKHGHLVWFNVYDPEKQQLTWYTHIPTGSRAASVMVVRFATKRNAYDEFERRAALVGQLEVQYDHK